MQDIETQRSFDEDAQGNPFAYKITRLRDAAALHRGAGFYRNSTLSKPKPAKQTKPANDSGFRLEPFARFLQGNDSPLGEVVKLGNGLLGEIVPLTDVTRALVVDTIASGYIGLSCRHCGKRYETLEDVYAATIWDGKQPMHKACYALWSKKASK